MALADLVVDAGVVTLVVTASALVLELWLLRPVRRLRRALGDLAADLQRTDARLDARSREVRVLLDSVDQGLVTVDVDGSISAERSARFDAWFDHPVPGRALWDLFPSLSPIARDSFAIGWSQLVEDAEPVELVLERLPSRIDTGSMILELRYVPTGEDPATRSVLVVVTDVTSRVVSERTRAFQRDLLRIIDRALRDRDAVVDFLRDADSLVALSTNVKSSCHDLRRHLHTLGGSCRLQGIQSIVALCHELETKLALRERPLTAEERTLLHERWSELRRGVDALLGQSIEGLTVSQARYVETLQAAIVGAPTQEIASQLASWATTPVAMSFERLGEHAHALAVRLGKEVEISADAAGAHLHDGRWRSFWGALAHAVRNSVDHGLESPEARALLGKPRAGKLTLLAQLDHTHFVVELQDDGRGIDWSLVATRLRERGLPAETADDLVEGLFAVGLTTRSAVDEVSGRGVGMSALREAVRELGGVVEIHSSPESGTTVRCVFPAACASVTPGWVLERELARQVTTLASPPRGPGESGSRCRAFAA